MRIEAAAFTEQGRMLAMKIFDSWQPEEIRYRETVCPLQEWARRCFSEKSALVFIGACGIAVRTIAPFVKDKLYDSPVIVVDEAGQFVIPILSGHVGGANELAVRIAKKCGAIPVITTATDVRGVFAIDVFAQKNQLTILNKDGIAKVSSKLLRGETATISIQPNRHVIGWTEELQRVAYPPEEETDIVISSDKKILEKGILCLRPRPYVLGIGCKKGKSEAEIDAWIREVISVPICDIAYLASIDQKREEPGLIAWATRNDIPFLTFSKEELLKLPGAYSSSEFVEQQVGVDNVCERAAMAAAGEGAELLITKQAGNGITTALAQREWRIIFDEAGNKA